MRYAFSLRRVVCRDRGAIGRPALHADEHTHRVEDWNALFEWEQARVQADAIRIRDDFPRDVGDALATIAAEDVVGYVEAVESVLESFETREAYLEDVPVADTVLVLQALADRRDMAADLESP